jgi:type III restriction enzyme
MIVLKQFQEDAAKQIADRYAFFASHDERPGTKKVGSAFFQALAAITGAGKTPILAEATVRIRNELSSEPIILWMSRARSVISQTYHNFNGGKYSSFVDGFSICQIKDLKHEMISDVSQPLLITTTTGLFNNKEQSDGDLKIYRRSQDTQGDRSIWERLIERKAGTSRRPLIIVYDEAHNLSEQQTDILRELQPEVWLLASATMRLPDTFQALVVQPIRNWVIGAASQVADFEKRGAVKDGRPDPDTFLTTAINSAAVVTANLVKNAIHFDGTTAPMERCIDELIKRQSQIKKAINQCALEIKAKAIYVCRTNITDDGIQDDPAKPFHLREAPPIRIWRYLVEAKKVNPATIAIYADLKFASGSKPDAVVHFSKGEDDFTTFKEGNYEHIIFNLSLQEGWDDPDCYLAYIDKSMGSSLQVQQVIGRVLRQPGATHYDREELNAAHFFIRVDNKSVFNAAIEEVRSKLASQGATIAISSNFSTNGKPAASEVSPRKIKGIKLHHIYIQKHDAMEEIAKLVDDFPTFKQGTPDTVGVAESGTATIKLDSISNPTRDVEWEKDGHTNPVRLRWLLMLAIKAIAPQAATVVDLKDKKWDVKVQVRSKADSAVRNIASHIAKTYFERSEPAYFDADEVTFGPLRVIDSGAHSFKRSLYPTYGKMNPEELAFAQGLDRAKLTWHRNPSGGGFSIPLLTPGETSNFYPDFLAWKDGMVYALETKGRHLITDAIARKLFDIYEGKTIRMHVRLVVKGKQDTLGGKATKDGLTVWRMKANMPRAFYCDTIDDAITECLK